MVFSFDRKRRRVDAQVEKLGIIRGEGGLANHSDSLADLRASVVRGLVPCWVA